MPGAARDPGSTGGTTAAGRIGPAAAPNIVRTPSLRPLERVVVAEDDPDISAVLALALGRVGGLAVTFCANGRAVLDLVRHDLPDLFLLDVMMPEMDGLETLARLGHEPRTAGVPVVLMTTRLRPPDLATYHARGALAVIAKPFDPLTLAQSLRELHAASGHART